MTRTEAIAKVVEARQKRFLHSDEHFQSTAVWDVDALEALGLLKFEEPAPATKAPQTRRTAWLPATTVTTTRSSDWAAPLTHSALVQEEDMVRVLRAAGYEVTRREQEPYPAQVDARVAHQVIADVVVDEPLGGELHCIRLGDTYAMRIVTALKRVGFKIVRAF